MLCPILICHKKNERSVKLLCDTLLDHCPGLGPNLKVLGAYGENSILSQACHALPFAMLLLCIWHIEENIKRNFPDRVLDPKKNEIMKMIFGNDIEKDLVDRESIEEFEQKLSQFYEYVSLDNDARSSVQYFKKYKDDIIKYHVMKGAVRACEVSENNDKFYSNSVEAINKLIKHWQNFQ